MSAEDTEFNLSNPPVGAAEIDFSPDLLSTIDFSELGSGFAGDIGNVGLTPDSLQALLNDSELMAEFAKVYPDAANILQGFPTDAEMKDLSKQAEVDVAPGGVMSGNPFGTKTGGTRPQTFLEKLGIGAGSDGKGILGTGISGTDAAKYAAMLAMAKMAYDDAQRAREEARGKPFKSSSGYQTVTGAGGVTGFKKAAMGGGIGSLDMAQGGRALPPRYLDGHSDGMADKVPANIDGKRPAALSDGEFVIPADVVSHLGNGNSNAGAKRLYKMMDDIRAARTGNPKQGKQINPDKFMPR